MTKKTSFFTALFFLFILGGLIAKTYKLNVQPFYEWDEGIYAQIAKEIIKNKTINTTFNDHIWLNKPPFSHLLIAFSFYLTNFSPFFARLIFAFFSFFSAIFVFKLTKKIFKNNRFPFLSVLLLYGSKIYLERSSILNTDIIIAFSWLGYFLFIDSFWKKTFFLIIGVWSKSLVGFYPLLFDLLFALNQKKFLKKRSLLIFIKEFFFQIFFASLWYLYASLKFGRYFFKAHFYDQIFKRVIKPIEFHWSELGIRYYPVTFFNDSKILACLFLLSLFLLSFKLLSLIKKKGFLFSKEFRNMLIFFPPLPLLVILLLSKSKIYWYLAFILPFISITALYPLSLLKNKKLKKLVLFFLFAVLAFFFVKNTYLYKHKIESDEKVNLAMCIKNHKEKKLAFLINQEGRKNYRFLKKNNLDTETTFIYGNSPSFVYYSDKKVDFFYDVEKFKREYQKYRLVVVQKEDILNLGLNFDNFNLRCKTTNELDHLRWLVYQK